MSSTSYIHRVLEQRGLQAAFDEAWSTVQRHAAEVDAWWNSPFFERRVLDGGNKKLWPTIEAQISRAHDLRDCDPEVPEFLYCDEDGDFYPVTIGPQSRRDTDEEAPFVYAVSAILANGKVVGHVMYTDH